MAAVTPSPEFGGVPSRGNSLRREAPGYTRVALFRRVPEVLAELGADVDATLSAADLVRDDFAEPDNQMPYAQLERLLVECVARTGCEHFGLRVCENSRLDDMGLPGLAARCATTVGDGLESLVRTYNLHRRGGVLDLVHAGEFSCLVFSVASTGALHTRHYQMGAIAVVFNILEDLCGRDWQATEVRFSYRNPANVRPFLRYFRAPVHFDADESGVVFESSWLARALPPVHEAHRQSVAAELRSAERRAFENFPALARDVIRRQMSHRPVSIESVAAALSLRPRSLERRLACDGDSYRGLQQSVQEDIAQQLLCETDLSVQEIADHLHFSSAANFATAFRRWTGQTPTQFRGNET